ncbi:MAG TPA: hypothetical protein VGL94_18080, partial [Ktedonobacteraceae bacterium]
MTYYRWSWEPTWSSARHACAYETTYDERGTDDCSQDNDTEHVYLLLLCLASSLTRTCISLRWNSGTDCIQFTISS